MHFVSIPAVSRVLKGKDLFFHRDGKKKQKTPEKNGMHGGEENEAFLLQQIKKKKGLCTPAWINSQRCSSFVNISNSSASVAYVIQTQLFGAFHFLVMTTRAASQSLIKLIISINITLL